MQTTYGKLEKKLDDSREEGKKYSAPGWVGSETAMTCLSGAVKNPFVSIWGWNSLHEQNMNALIHKMLISIEKFFFEIYEAEVTRVFFRKTVSRILLFKPWNRRRCLKAPFVFIQRKSFLCLHNFSQYFASWALNGAVKNRDRCRTKTTTIKRRFFTAFSQRNSSRLAILFGGEKTFWASFFVFGWSTRKHKLLFFSSLYVKGSRKRA